MVVRAEDQKQATMLYATACRPDGPTAAWARLIMLSRLQGARNRQGRHQHALIALGAELRGELVSDVPGEDDGALRLIHEHPVLLHHRNERAGHALADFQRAFDLADVIDDGFVEADIVEQGRGARRSADADDAAALL